MKTDDRGTFALGIKPGVASSLTARHTGFGPAMQAIRVGHEPQKITLSLTTPSTLTGRSSTPRGSPLPAHHSGQFLANLATLEQELRTGEDGRFAWNEAPGDEVKVSVYAEGYTSREDVALMAGRPDESC